MESTLLQDKSAPKSEIVGEHGRETQESFDYGKPEIYEESPGK